MSFAEWGYTYVVFGARRFSIDLGALVYPTDEELSYLLRLVLSGVDSLRDERVLSCDDGYMFVVALDEL